MEVTLYKRIPTGNVYFLRDSDGRLIGQIDWIMAGANVGLHYYSRDTRYKPPKIRKLFWKTYCPRFQMEFSDRT